VTLMDLTPAIKSPLSAGGNAGRRPAGNDAAAWCPVIVQLRELGDTSRQSVDGDITARETLVRACDSRVRKRLIYTSRTSKVRVVMPLTAAATRRPSQQPVIGHYLLHFAGTRHHSCVSSPAESRSIPRACPREQPAVAWTSSVL